MDHHNPREDGSNSAPSQPEGLEAERAATIKMLGEIGMSMVPLHPMSKKPVHEGWQEHQHADNQLEDFEPGMNVGVVLGDASGGVVDIDLDNPVARAIADDLLPQTGVSFGRPSTPRAHRLYKVKEPGGTVQFRPKQDPAVIGGEKGMIVEYRANGGQTMCPPSIHPDGEIVRFDEFGEIAEVAEDELLAGCSCIAACVELIPHYKPGSRQDFVLALTGALLRAGVGPEVAQLLLDVIIAHTGDEEADMRLQAIEGTINKFESGQAITGADRLISVIGDGGSMVWKAVVRHLGLKEEKARPKKARPECETLDELNDSAVAKDYAAHAKGRVVFSEQCEAYFVYQDGVWIQDSQMLRVIRDFDCFVTGMARQRQVTTKHDLSAQKAILRYRNHTPAKAALALAKAYLRLKPDKFDRDDLLLAIENGVIDLRTGELRPHAPENYVTYKLDVAYDPNATCPTCERFLNETFLEDKPLIDYVIGILGYFLTARTDRQEFYIFYGSGQNGKGVLTNLIWKLLGTYAISMMDSTFFEAKYQNSSNDLASLEGKRLALIPEAESDNRLHSSLIKRLTGEDAIKIKTVYKDAREIKPTAKYVMVVNPLPDLNICDKALKRRVKCVPFENEVPNDKKDHQLLDKLWAERSGVLNVLLQGVQRYMRGELTEPQVVQDATRDYFAGKDSISAFFQECIERVHGDRIEKGELYQAYEAFCLGQDEAMPPVSRKDFTRYIKETLDLGEQKSGKDRFWKGIRFVEGKQELSLVVSNPGSTSRTG